MLSIRPATVNDVTLLKTLICELAEYEREPDAVVITEADLLRDGFGPQPKFRALIAEWNGQPAGYAFFFGFYSTWEGRPGLSRIFLCGRSFVEEGLARACWLPSLAVPGRKTVTESVGKFWTGINRPSSSTTRSEASS